MSDEEILPIAERLREFDGERAVIYAEIESVDGAQSMIVDASIQPQAHFIFSRVPGAAFVACHHVLQSGEAHVLFYTPAAARNLARNLHHYANLIDDGLDGIGHKMLAALKTARSTLDAINSVRKKDKPDESQMLLARMEIESVLEKAQEIEAS